MSVKMAASAHYSRAGAGASLSASATVGGGGFSASASVNAYVRAQVKQPPVPTTPQKAAYNILSNHRYHVAIDGLEHAAFNEVSGLQIETETMDFVEGGVNDRVLRLPVRSKMGNITLKRGVVSGQQLLEWYLSVVNGYLDARNVTIIVYHPNGNVLVRFELLQAYPVKWSGPQFAGSGDAVAVETLELAHAGFLQISR
ncbi:phage tail protein [Deinococcus multiflagellatus]|uniref:phage tail protein n=1 Tax=Deinococcus multiflagellatus TaxID=1656887 RepID=UPI001CCFCF35|nr:phage tail protein [Deinococcus multiflagellatus]MBZ9713598.1 phage tail protein [Deinococcus multiflagellatus]